MIVDPMIMMTVVLTFLLAGTVKGVIGLGLPTVSLGILAAVLDLPTAMALLIVPSLITNIWQAVVGGHGIEIFRRIWPFLLMAGGAVLIGAAALTRWDIALMSMLLGILLIAYSALGLSGLKISISPRNEVWAGPVLGLINGVLTGMTGTFVVPGVMFLQSIDLPRDKLVQAMGMLFTVSAIALAVALQRNNMFSMDLGVTSSIALIPAVIGMIIGQRIRGFLSENLFRQVFFIGILLIGGYILIRS
jgi:uncharacterized membrane protein YfcA